MATATKVERTEAEREADARKITCKICHAPVGFGCVSVVWLPEDGTFEPYVQDRAFHPKRLQWYDKHIERYGKVH